jgi:hypothetical protein
MMHVHTWEGLIRNVPLENCETIGRLKAFLATTEGVSPRTLRLYRDKDAASVANKKGCPFANVAYIEYELSDDVLLADLAKTSCSLFLELNQFTGLLRGGTCPHPGRNTKDFALPDRSPWARHKPADSFHQLALKVHGYSAIASWIFFSMIYFSVKGSGFHVAVGRLFAYVQLPIAMLSGLALFRMLFFRSSAFENIMKTDGPITIFVFSVEMVMTWLEAFLVPHCYYRMVPSARAPLACAMLTLHILLVLIYMFSLTVLGKSVKRSAARRSPKESNAFENAVEMFVLVLPMIITNVLNIPVHLSVLEHGTWSWVAHHKLNALLLPYIAMPGNNRETVKPNLTLYRETQPNPKP